jgi:cobyrinic acid a,c-diamide synthase
LIVAAPSTGSGKTVVTLGLLRALRRRGVRVRSAKVGPDYIDPAFHAAASGAPCRNLDSWAMRPDTVVGLVGALSDDAELVVCEGVMGLFDGANVVPDQSDGSTANLAELTGWPVLLVADVRGMAGSAAALLGGFVRHRPAVRVAGALFNRVGGPGHRDMLLRGCRAALPELPVLGLLPRDETLGLPSRHLGLVQALERPDLEQFLDRAAAWIEAHVDLDAVIALARPSLLAGLGGELPGGVRLPPLGQRIAVARDAAFAFTYQDMLDGWRRAGAELTEFSPLADEAPDGDAVYLPGGYPELHGERLGQCRRFRDGVRAVAAAGGAVYGECGGYMALGRMLLDRDGVAWPMLGLLPLVTSFAERRLHLGYRRGVLSANGPLGSAGSRLRGHEFHYATVIEEGSGQSLLTAADAAGKTLGTMGLIEGRVAGSFLHVIDRED